MEKNTIILLITLNSTRPNALENPMPAAVYSNSCCVSVAYMLAIDYKLPFQSPPIATSFCLAFVPGEHPAAMHHGAAAISGQSSRLLVAVAAALLLALQMLCGLGSAVRCVAYVPHLHQRIRRKALDPPGL